MTVQGSLVGKRTHPALYVQAAALAALMALLGL